MPPLPTPPPSLLSPLVDNALKLIIAALVSILIWLGTDLRDAVDVLSVKIVSMEVAIAEMKVEIRHLGGNGKSASNTIR
jgi:hypothetical protein